MLAELNGTNSVGNGESTIAPEPRLVGAAHEFEAQLMKELLQPMTRTSSLAADDDGDEGEEGALGEFAAESLAGALSAHGGFGVADRIVSQLSHSGTSSNHSQGIGNVRTNQVISAHK